MTHIDDTPPNMTGMEGGIEETQQQHVNMNADNGSFPDHHEYRGLLCCQSL